MFVILFLNFRLFLKHNRFLHHLKEKLVWSINYMSSLHQVQQATRHGAIGIIIYSDPADYSNGQTKDVYPHSIWLPPSGTQRGTVKKTDGDPLTPGYPATGSSLFYIMLYIVCKVEQVDSSFLTCNI